MHRNLAVVALSLWAAAAGAQLVPLDPDWNELDAAPPPAFDIKRLIKVEVPGSTLRFGVDPVTVSVGSDGVARYVVAAIAAGGNVTAIYEGIRCTTGEARVYARYNADTGWTVTRTAPWRSLREPQPSHHSLAIAKAGVCMGNGTNGSAEQIVQGLRFPVDTRNGR